MRTVLQIGGLSAAAAISVFAATATTSFQVTATVLEKCSVSATDLAFGNYDPTSGTANDQTSTVSVDCTLLTDYNATLDVGLGSGAAYSTGRFMTGETNTSGVLKYNLYRDSAHTEVWGDESDGSYSVLDVGEGLSGPKDHTVYGRIPTGLYAQPQDYSDTIQVTVTY